MTWKKVQLPLSSAEIRQIIETCSAEAVLVGGQALATWSQVYRIPPPPELSSGISADIDFIGSLRVARKLGNALKRSGGDWKLHPVTAGDATAQTAKLSLTVKNEGYKEIDFLWSIVGVDTDQARDRAVEMTPPGFSRGMKILHPLDVLASRLHNLADLPDKRNAHGIAQGRLAISVVHAFITQAHGALKERDVLPFVEEVRRIALHKKLGRVCHEYRFDVLQLFPSSFSGMRIFCRNAGRKSSRWWPGSARSRQPGLPLRAAPPPLRRILHSSNNPALPEWHRRPGAQRS